MNYRIYLDYNAPSGGLCNDDLCASTQREHAGELPELAILSEQHSSYIYGVIFSEF